MGIYTPPGRALEHGISGRFPAFPATARADHDPQSGTDWQNRDRPVAMGHVGFFQNLPQPGTRFFLSTLALTKLHDFAVALPPVQT
jgi:hypothetical protein